MKAERHGKWLLISRKAGISEWIEEKPNDTNILIRVVEIGGTKQQLVLHARMSDYCFVEPEFPGLPPMVLFFQFEESRRMRSTWWSWTSKIYITDCAYLSICKYSLDCFKYRQKRRRKVVGAAADRSFALVSFNDYIASTTWRTTVLLRVDNLETKDRRKKLRTKSNDVFEDITLIFSCLDWQLKRDERVQPSIGGTGTGWLAAKTTPRPSDTTTKMRWKCWRSISRKRACPNGAERKIQGFWSRRLKRLKIECLVQDKNKKYYGSGIVFSA